MQPFSFISGQLYTVTDLIQDGTLIRVSSLFHNPMHVHTQTVLGSTNDIKLEMVIFVVLNFLIHYDCQHLTYTGSFRAKIGQCGNLT